MTDSGQTAASLSDDALLCEMGQAQVLIDVTVATPMLMFSVTPLTSFPPLVVGRRAKKHRLRRGWAHAIACDITARSSFIQASLTEETRQRHAELFMNRKITTQQPDLSAFTFVPVHRSVLILFIAGRYLTYHPAALSFIIVSDSLTDFLFRILPVGIAILFVRLR